MTQVTINGKPCSELGWKTVKALDMIFGGMHNVPFSVKSRKAFDQTLERLIECVVCVPSFASYDFDLLTRATIAAHLFQVRIEISGVNQNYISIEFYNRKNGGTMFERHPNIESLIERLKTESAKHNYAPGAIDYTGE
jgi:hypothetical protein